MLFGVQVVEQRVQRVAEHRPRLPSSRRQRHSGAAQRHPVRHRKLLMSRDQHGRHAPQNRRHHRVRSVTLLIYRPGRVTSSLLNRTVSGVVGQKKVGGAESCNFSTVTVNFFNRILTDSWKLPTVCSKFEFHF